MKTRLITYSTGKFEQNALALCDSAKSCGFDSVECLNPGVFANTTFAARNKAILSASRGAGYWLWKPYIIKQQVDHLSKGDVLLYSDAGRTGYYQFTTLPIRLLELVASSEMGFLTGVAIPHLGPIARWTKRDCLRIMEADVPAMHEKPIVQTTWSVWTNTHAARDFLDAWLHYCEIKSCLTDAPNELALDNLPQFVSHRHDQSICSILAHKKSAPFLDFSTSVTHSLLALRPNSELGNTFYKRAQNANDLLSGASPAILLREYFRLRKFR